MASSITSSDLYKQSRVLTNSPSPQKPAAILSRLEAKEQLTTLSPDSLEFNQLQNALAKYDSGIVTIDGEEGAYKVNLMIKEHRLMGGFGSSEHIAIGKAVKLKGIGQNEVLIVKGRNSAAKVTFEYIIALAGDFYGVPSAAISLPGGGYEEKRDRFMNSFNTLAQGDPERINKIMFELEQEFRQVSRSSTPRHCYSSQMMNINNRIKEVKSDIDELLVDNSDHFEKNAIEAYQIGHKIALEMAAQAGDRTSAEGLKRAYAIDAFACHFLTDLFASGHTRNQRGELELFLANTLRFDHEKAKVLSGILTGAQHEKDGKDGLLLENNRGESWQAYGDGYFFLPQSEKNRQKAIQATQLSVDEVYKAYSRSDATIPSEVRDLLPTPTKGNLEPLYTIKEQKLTLFHRGSTIKIESKEDYLKHGISLALSHLPETYITGFIQGKVDVRLPVIVNKVVLPTLDLLTGWAWRIVGLASQQQVKEARQEINSKIDDMANLLAASFKISNQIIKITQEIKETVNRIEAKQKWNQEYSTIREYVETIMDAIHTLSGCNSDKTPLELESYGERMAQANNRLNRVLTEGTSTQTDLVAAYQDIVLAQRYNTQKKTIVATTLWYRWLIDLQVNAFGISKANWIVNKKLDERAIEESEKKFEKDLLKQIERHVDRVDVDLIYKPIHYIRIQYDNIHKKEIAFENFLNDKNN